ncbi:MAG: hypothetical protein LQ338_005844 [Usnochroma carphineum]|nr:MAG: hypothetical protein LQ338_005844 [Usnochroma carphineum]
MVSPASRGSNPTSSLTLPQPHDNPDPENGTHDEQNSHSVPSKNEKEAYRVDWEPNDQDNPKNWKTAYKGWLTLQLGMLALAASLGSSIISPAENAIAKYTHISPEVATLSLSLYVLGFAFGPLLWAPISEVWGRRWSLLPPMFCLGVFSIGTATSKTPAAVFITRFLGGVFGSAPVSNVAAALGDIWAPKTRGTAVTFYAVCVTGGPTLGPVIGSSLTVSYLGWRWTEYIEAIWVFSIFLLGLFALPELYSPVLLKKKAIRLRKTTGDQAYWHPHEDVKLDFKSIVTKQISRPLRMLFTEPMVTCITLYASFVYGLLYLTLEVFPIVFEEIRGYKLVISTLPFLALFVGVLCAMAINLTNQPRYMRIVDQNKGKPVPEARLPPMLVGGVLFVIGLFWFGWTAAPRYHFMLPVVAAGFIGAGFNVIFQQAINFLVDTYALYAASAVSANTFLRSILASAFPLVARPMFHNLGVGPAMSLLGGIACLALPVPLLFMKYGRKLRSMSKFAPIDDT